jgi:hypothetical protein
MQFAYNYRFFLRSCLNLLCHKSGTRGQAKILCMEEIMSHHVVHAHSFFLSLFPKVAQKFGINQNVWNQAMAAPALWIIWSHHLLCLIVPHHLWYTNALYSMEKGVIPTTSHFHSTCSYLGNMCHQQFQTLVQTSVISHMMLVSAHNIVNTCSNRLPSA